MGILRHDNDDDDDGNAVKTFIFGMSYALANNYFPLQQKITHRKVLKLLLIRIKFATRVPT